MNLFLSGISTETLPFPPCFSVPVGEVSKAETLEAFWPLVHGTQELK